jgi:hypothetical protein
VRPALGSEPLNEGPEDGLVTFGVQQLTSGAAKAATAFVVTVALIAALAVPAAADARVKRCGDSPIGGVYNIKAKNLPCRKARRMVLSWYHRGEPIPAHFRCRLQSGASIPARCRDGRRVVSFFFAE